MIALLLLGWMLIALLATYGTFLYWRHTRRKLEAPAARGVAVIVPIKGNEGDEDRIRDFLEGCLSQDGADYRVIVAVEADDDPTAGVVARLLPDATRLSLVVAGRTTERGQKVHNQLAAIAALQPEDRIVVFADADVALAPDWLRQLLRPIILGRAEVASGYRWILPADGTLASRWCAMADWGIATAARSKRWNLCWGGSMALTRAALDAIDLPRCWDRSVLDDIVLTRAARRLGFAVHAPLQVLVPSPVKHDVGSLLRFGRRQYMLVRVHAPWHWACAGVALAVPTLAGAVALASAWTGDKAAIGCLLAAFVLQQVRAELRNGIARQVLSPEAAQATSRLMRRGRWQLAGVHLMHLSLWLASGLGSTIEWGNRRYRLVGHGRVEVLDEAGLASPRWDGPP